MWPNMRAMHFRPNLRKDQMNCSASDIITPSLVETAERLHLQSRDAIELVVVLLVGTFALLLDQRAESYFCDFLDRKVVGVMSDCSFDPGLQVRNPRVVVTDLTLVVEAPECYLKASCQLIDDSDINLVRHTWLKVLVGLDVSKAPVFTST